MTRDRKRRFYISVTPKTYSRVTELANLTKKKRSEVMAFIINDFLNRRGLDEEKGDCSRSERDSSRSGAQSQDDSQLELVTDDGSFAVARSL